MTTNVEFLAQFLSVDSESINCSCFNPTVYYHGPDKYLVIEESELDSTVQPDGMTCWTINENEKYKYIVKVRAK